MSMCRECTSVIPERYIVIPDELFRDFTRCPTTIDLTLQTSTRGSSRTAGIYPPPRPLTSSHWNRRTSKTKDYKVIGVYTPRIYSAMDVEDDPDDAINIVARANCAKSDTSSILPKIRASPCLMHSKSSRRRQDLMYSSSHHGGRVPGHPDPNPYSDKVFKPGITLKQRSSPKGTERTVNKYNPATYRRAHLPGDHLSKDFIMSWLMQGPSPNQLDHVPGISRDSKDSRKTKLSPKQKHTNVVPSE